MEAAWHHRKTYRSPGKTMRERWELAPVATRLRGHEGNRRLHQRWQAFDERKKKPVIANVAIARELARWAANICSPSAAEDATATTSPPSECSFKIAFHHRVSQ